MCRVEAAHNSFSHTWAIRGGSERQSEVRSGGSLWRYLFHCIRCVGPSIMPALQFQHADMLHSYLQ